MVRKLFLPTILVLFFTLTFLPVFFTIYREAAFNTLPRDDYAPFLLKLIGQGGQYPGAPYGYRLFSVALAIPFYYILPAYAFTNLQNVDVRYLQATEALAMVSYLSILLTALMIYRIARDSFHSSRFSSIIVGGLSIFLTDFISRPGIDPLAVLMICVLIYGLNNRLIFIPLIILSVGINEKILILFAVLLLGRWIYTVVRKESTKFRFRLQLLFSVFAVISYFIIRWIFPLPGFENQLDPAKFLSQFLASLSYTFSLKGFILNLIPILIVFVLALLAVFSFRKIKLDNINFSESDLLVFIFLFVIAAAVDLQLTIGRVVMFSFPLYLPILARYLDLKNSNMQSSSG